MGRERAERRGGVGVATAMCVLVASLVIWSPPAQAQVASRAGAEAKAAAPLTLKVVHSVDRKLRGNFNGVGPVAGLAEGLGEVLHHELEAAPHEGHLGGAHQDIHRVSLPHR